MYSSLAQMRRKALMKTCTGGQEGPPHGLTPRKETAGATHTEMIKTRDATNSLNLRNFYFCSIISLRSYKIIHFNSKAT